MYIDVVRQDKSFHPVNTNQMDPKAELKNICLQDYFYLDSFDGFINKGRRSYGLL